MTLHGVAIHAAQLPPLPNQIRAARLRAGLSQTALGDRIEVSKVTISSLEVGRMQLTLDYIRRFAQVLAVSPLELLNEDEQHSLLRTGELALLRDYRKAGKIQRAMIRRVAEPIATPPRDTTSP